MSLCSSPTQTSQIFVIALMLIQYRVRPFPHPVRLLAKNPDPGLKSKICKIFRKIIFFRIVQNVALVVALFVKILQTPKYYNRGITRQLRNLCLRPKNILIFFPTKLLLCLPSTSWDSQPCFVEPSAVGGTKRTA